MIVGSGVNGLKLGSNIDHGQFNSRSIVTKE